MRQLKEPRNQNHWILLLGILVGARFVFAEGCPSESAVEPSGVVKEYCVLDFEGVRLDGGHPKWPLLRSLVQGEKEWPDDQVVVVTGYRVLRSKVHGNSASVEVVYRVKARLIGVETFVADEKRAEAEFRLSRSEGKWRIAELNVHPHVSPAALGNHLRRLIDADRRSADRSRLARLERVLKQVEQLKPRGSSH